MGFRVWVWLLVIVAGILVAAGGAAGGEPASAKESSSKSNASGDRSRDATAEPRRGKKRPGCRRFCQQAGGFGDDSDEPPAVEIPAQEIGGTRDRIIVIRSTCKLDRDCVGAIILTNRRFEYGRADLEIPAGATQKVRVGISRDAKEWLAKHGPDQKAFATVPLVNPMIPVSISGDLTILAP